MAKRKRDQPEPMAETMLDHELIVFLTERSQSGDPLTAEEFAEALEDEEVAKRFAALKLQRERRQR